MGLNHIVLGFIWLEAVFWNPSVALLYKLISTFCENMLYFSKLLNWSWEMSTCRYSTQIQESKCRKRFISFYSILSFCWLKVLSAFGTPFRRHAGEDSVCCIYQWQRVGKLALLPCGLEEEHQKSFGYQQLLIKSLKMLETVFDSSMWSPCSPAQSYKVLHSAPLRLTYQKLPVRLQHISSCSQEKENIR